MTKPITVALKHPYQALQYTGDNVEDVIAFMGSISVVVYTNDPNLYCPTFGKDIHVSEWVVKTNGLLIQSDDDFKNLFQIVPSESADVVSALEELAFQCEALCVALNISIYPNALTDAHSLLNSIRGNDASH